MEPTHGGGQSNQAAQFAGLTLVCGVSIDRSNETITFSPTRVLDANTQKDWRGAKVDGHIKIEADKGVLAQFERDYTPGQEYNLNLPSTQAMSGDATPAKR
jgi:hypothetical protein